jgi:hypothetical protein
VKIVFFIFGAKLKAIFLIISISSKISCQGPFTGKRCEIYLDPCKSNPCGKELNCVSANNRYTCQCKEVNIFIYSNLFERLKYNSFLRVFLVMNANLILVLVIHVKNQIAFVFHSIYIHILSLIK